MFDFAGKYGLKCYNYCIRAFCYWHGIGYGSYGKGYGSGHDTGYGTDYGSYGTDYDKGYGGIYGELDIVSNLLAILVTMTDAMYLFIEKNYYDGRTVI